MTKYLLLLPLIYLVLVADRALAPVWSISGVAPHLTALLLAMLVLTARPPSGTLLGGAIGLAGDLAGGGWMGIGTLSGAVAGWALSQWHGHWWSRWWPSRVLLTTAAVALLAAVPAVAEALDHGRWSALAGVVAAALGIGLYSGAVSLPVWLAVDWWRRPVPA